MINVLITGATGFVGNHLRLCISEYFSLKLLSRSGLKTENHFNADIRKDTNYSNIVEGIEVVIHCAARVHIMEDAASDPLSEFRAVNTLGTLNLAKQAAAAGVKRFIFVSSIKVNGESTNNRPPFTANDSPAPEDPYGVSKLEAEQQLLELGKRTGMEIVIIRPPLVYGEGVKANFGALMSFVGKGFPLPFRSIKHNKRSFVSVYNLVDLIKVCIEHPKASNQIFLASDDHDLSTTEMVALMARAHNKKNFALPVPIWCFKLAGKLLNKSDFIDRLTGSLQLDITHTKSTLNWTPPYSVEHGFKLAAKKASQDN